MAKQLVFDERARESLKHGVDTLTQAVKWFAEDRVLLDGARTIIFT